MTNPFLDFSARGWGRVILWTFVGTAFCVAVALYVDSFSFARLTDEALRRAILIDVFVPMGLAVPLLFFFTTKLRELAIAHDQLARYAATDSLTSVLNRAAFTSLVEGYLADVRAGERQGALLVLDADNFKKINDRFGHDQGDIALRAIASTVRSMLRGVDIVGRLGGEEFGVFLPGSSLVQAEAVAERIRSSVASTAFVPAGTPVPLTISVGGAVFDKRLPFADLFRLADQQLYVAKNRGRNRVSITSATPYLPMEMAAA